MCRPHGAPTVAVMATRPARILPLALAVLTGVSLSACAPDVFTHSAGDTRTEAGRVDDVTIGGGAGTLVLRRDEAAAAVTIARVIHYQHDEPTGRYDRLEGTRLVLDSDCGDDCYIDYTITVPNVVSVAGHLGSGDVSLTDIRGAVVTTGSGDITITRPSADVHAEAGSGEVSTIDSAGRVSAKAGSGDVRLERARGPVTGTTGSGDMTISMATTESVEAHASSGDLSVRVPTGSSYRVDAVTGSGAKDIGIGTDANSEHLLDLETGSGRLTVSTT